MLVPMNAASFDTDPTSACTDEEMDGAHHCRVRRRNERDKRAKNSDLVTGEEGHPENVHQTFSLFSSRWHPSSWSLHSLSAVELLQSKIDSADDMSQPDTPVTHVRYACSDSTFSNTSQKKPDNNPISLEGTLAFRKSRSASGSSAWKQAYLVLDLTDGGSLICFREKPELGANNQRSVRRPSFNRVLSGRRRRAPGDTRPKMPESSILELVKKIMVATKDVNQSDGSNSEEKSLLRFSLNSDVGWVAKDVESCSAEFVVEIPDIESLTDTLRNGIRERLSEGSSAESLQRKPLRLYFRCARNSIEKSLWVEAFERIGRLSRDIHSKRGIQALLSTNIKIKHRRSRNQLSALLAREGWSIFSEHDNKQGSFQEDDPTFRKPKPYANGYGEKEYLVYPMYAYPNRWMTDTEMHKEMLKPSETYHDLRVSMSNSWKEIGMLRVEVLECVGLPVLDLASETDAVVYFVCGPHAFATDVIWNRLNPKWLPKSRRACVFPLYHAFARLFVGVFDDDGKNEKDDFAGRVVIDLSCLRPRSTYDVTLPLRVSSQVYSRKPRGSIRLRFTLEWHSDRDALLSYIPKSLHLPSKKRPGDALTVLCADEKAFRNVAITVHGIHLPGKFSPHLFKATMREFNFVRKVAMNTVRDLILEIVLWKNPVFSAIIFSAWMHCIYRGMFSLVPVYSTVLLGLLMLRTYAFYGNNAPVRQGFASPSFQEMILSLLSLRDGNVLAPLKVTPVKHSGKDGRRTYTSTKTIINGETQRPWWLFRILGFVADNETETSRSHLDMEFAYAQGHLDPLNGKICYKKLSIQESVVTKTKVTSNKPPKENSQVAVDDVFGLSNDVGNVLNRELPHEWKHCNEQQGLLTSYEGETRFEDLPPRLRFPDQDIDKGLTKTKRFTEELDELRDNVHRLTCHAFHDRTHVRPKDGAHLFAAGKRYGTSSASIDSELQRLLNTGPYSSANPVIARIGLYLEPIVDAMQSTLAVSRVAYKIFTWRDPFLSFWCSAGIVFASLVLYLFPWRLFLFIVGATTLGPQNWLFRKLDEKQMAPRLVRDALANIRMSKYVSRHNDTELTLRVDQGSLSMGHQPIFSSHTSDDSAPQQLGHNDVDPRTLHQVCVPYSQLNGTQRFFDWPPEPQYAMCTPNQCSIEESLINSESHSIRRLQAYRAQSWAGPSKKNKILFVSRRKSHYCTRQG